MRAAGEEVGKCCPVRINSGRFGVEWQKTKAVLEAGFDVGFFGWGGRGVLRLEVGEGLIVTIYGI